MARRPNPKTAAGGRAPQLGVELGVPNLMPVSSWSTWEQKPLQAGNYIVGRDPSAPTRNDIDFMMRHEGQVQGMLRLLTLPIRAAFTGGKWISPKHGSGQQETEFANLMWSLPPQGGGMQVSADMFLKQTLLALPFGFSAFEIVKDYRKDGPLAGKFVIDKMAYRDNRTVHFLVDDHGVFQGFRQQTQFANRYIDEIIAKENAWYWANDEEHNPMYGRSIFESAYHHYEIKRRLVYITHLAAQFAAVPGRIAQLTSGISPKNIAIIKRDLAEFGFNTAMTVPQGVDVKPFTGNSSFNYTGLLEYQDKLMCTSILAKFLQQEDRQVLIDNGKADASADLFVQLLETITSEIAQSWSNKLMPMFIDYNFTTKVYPEYKFAPLTDATKDAILSIFQTLSVAPTNNASPELFRMVEMSLAERLGFDIDWNKVAKADQQAQADQMAQQTTKENAPNGAQEPKGQGGTPGSVTPAKPTTPSSKPSRLPTAIPQIKASAAQQEEFKKAVAILSNIIGLDDVPDNFAPNGIVDIETED